MSIVTLPDAEAEGRPQKPASLRVLMPHLLALAVVTSVYGVSLWQSLYRFDPHHYGLMLSYAQDFCQGRTPYLEIGQVYGWLSTIIHGLAFCYGGQRLVTLSAVTIAFYGIGLFLLYWLAIRVTGSAVLALFVLVIAALMHPLTVYPWPNYIAFPFLMAGLLALVRVPLGERSALAAGVALGLAVLARENLLPAAICIIGTLLVLDLLRPQSSRRAGLRLAAVAFGGLLAPLLVFFIYLVWIAAVGDWFNVTVRTVMDSASRGPAHLSDIRGLGAIKPLFWYLRAGVFRLEPRTCLIALMIAASAAALALHFLGLVRRVLSRELALVASASLLLLSATLPSPPEVFRIATGSIVGLIPLFALFRAGRVDRIAFVFFLGALIPTLPNKDGSNFVVRAVQRNQAVEVGTPGVLAGQRWQIAQAQYYRDIMSIFTDLEGNPHCRFRYHYNATSDAFIAVISPFERLQLFPMFTGRPEATAPNTAPQGTLDLAFASKLTDRDLVLIRQVNPDGASLEAPPGFAPFRRVTSPPGDFYGNVADAIEFLVPADCLGPEANPLRLPLASQQSHTPIAAGGGIPPTGSPVQPATVLYHAGLISVDHHGWLAGQLSGLVRRPATGRFGYTRRGGGIASCRPPPAGVWERDTSLTSKIVPVSFPSAEPSDAACRAAGHHRRPNLPRGRDLGRSNRVSAAAGLWRVRTARSG